LESKFLRIVNFRSLQTAKNNQVKYTVKSSVRYWEEISY